MCLRALMPPPACGQSLSSCSEVVEIKNNRVGVSSEIVDEINEKQSRWGIKKRRRLQGINNTRRWEQRGTVGLEFQ